MAHSRTQERRVRRRVKTIGWTLHGIDTDGWIILKRDETGWVQHYASLDAVEDWMDGTGAFAKKDEA